MANDGHHPTIDFDHHSPEFGVDAPAKFARLREQCPVAYSESYEGFWVASTYEAARQVISDADAFTVEKSADGTRGGKLIPTSKHAPSIVPGLLDGEAHDRLRRPLRAAFSRGSIERTAAPITRQVADTLAAQLAARPEFDFANEFSFQLTVGTIFELVGLDEIEDRTQFILMLEDAFAIDPAAGGDRDAIASATSSQFAAAREHVRAIVRSRQQASRDDLISYMVTRETGLTEQEVVDLTLSIVLGGVRTTASSLDHVAVHLDADRDLRARLLAEPAQIPNAVDEIIRLATVTPLVARTATRDVEVSGCTIRAGERIAALLASANRDEQRFPDADTVKLDRRDGLHLAFGAGLHYCLGIWLAKMELREAVTALLRHMPDYEVVRERVEPYRLVGVNNGYARLPVRPNVTHAAVSGGQD